MDKIADKFNIFDIFSMLIPGIGISSLFCVSLSFKYYNIWQNMGNEKYIIFLFFSYFCGVIYHEIGTILDRKFLYKIFYGGNPREVFLLENGHEKIMNEDFFYKDALYIKNYFVSKLNLQVPTNMTIPEEKNFNSIIFNYCLNLSEYQKLTEKSEKMIVISEMSRSLFWGCISTILLDIIMIFQVCQCYFYVVEIFLLFFISFILMQRKIRFEKYRLRILLRTLVLYLKMNL